MAITAQWGIDADELVREDRVHRRIYVDGTIFDAEMHRIFERTWVFVGHESEIPHPGDYKTTYIGRNPIIMSRGKDGEIHILMNRCMHRGAVVCREERGNAPAFRCSYHGWTYNNQGDLVLVTGRDGYGPEFRQEELGLIKAPRVDSYRGFVFACLDPEVEPLSDYLGKAKHYIDITLDASPDGEIEVRCGVQKYEYRANWKLQVENWIDSYHGQFTHETAFGIRDRRQDVHREDPRADQHLPGGINTTFARGHGTANSKNGRASQWGRTASKYPEYLKALEERHGPRRAKEVLDEADLQLLVFPNLFIQMRQQHLRVVRPVAVDRTVVYAYPYRLKGAPEKLNTESMRYVGYWASAAGFGQPDDVEVWVRCQAGLQVTAAQWVLFMRGLGKERVEPDGEVVGERTTELQLRGIYKEWKRLMGRD